MRARSIIVFIVLSVFPNYKVIAENETQTIQNASEILREHFSVVFDTQSIDLDSKKSQDENVGIRLVNVNGMDEVSIQYEGKTLKAKDNCVFPLLIKNGILSVSYAGRERGNCYASLELYTPKKELQHRYHMQQLLSILLGNTPSVKKSINANSDLGDLGVSLQKTLAAFHNTKTHLEFPQYLIDKNEEKQGDDFDVEKYFTALKHISMEEGYRLNYVYHYGGMGGSPILYSRKKDQLPYKNFEEYINVVQKDPRWDEIKLIEEEYSKKLDAEGKTAANEWRKNQLENCPNYRHWEWYLNDICVDGTDQSWLELVVIHLLGEQFYLFWHANYNDTMIIADYSALSDISNLYVTRERQVSSIIGLLGSAIEVRPIVEVKDKIVTVSIVTFSKWGGLSEQVFSINKERPHRITEMSDNTLISYHCNVAF